MRPALKKTLKIAAGLAGVTAFGASIALFRVTRPEWQRARILELLHEAGWSGDIRESSVGLTGEVSLAGLDLAAPDGGPRVSVARAHGSVDLWDALFGQPHITGLTVEGLQVRLGSSDGKTKSTPSVASAPAPVTMPRVLIDAASVTGEITPADGVPVAFTLRVRSVDTTSGGRLVASATRAGVTLKADGDIRFGGAPVVGGTAIDFLRSARPMPDMEADVVFSPGSRPVRMSLRGDAERLALMARDGAAFAELKLAGAYGETPLFTLAWKLDETALAGRWQVEPSRFDTTGRASWKPGGALEAQADYSGRPLFEGGPGHVSFSGSLEMPGSRRFLIRQARVAAGDTADAPRFTAETLSPIAFSLTEGGAPRAENVSGELLKARLDGVPVSWFRALTAGAPVAPRSGRIDGAFLLEAPARGGWRLHMPKPVTASDLTVALPRGRSVGGLRLSVAGEVASSADGTLLLRDASSVLEIGGGEAAALRKVSFSWAPSGAHRGTCDFALNPALWPQLFGTAAASGYFRETGLTLAGTVAFDGASARESVLRTANLSALTADGATPVVARLAAPVPLTSAGWREASALIKLREAPLALVNPFLEGEPLEGVARDASIRLAMTPHGMSLASTADVSVYGLVWRPAGIPNRDPSPIGVTGGFSWTPSSDGWRLRLERVDAINRTGRGLRGNLDWIHLDHAPDRVLANVSGSLDAVSASIPAWIPARVRGGEFAVVGDVKLDGEAVWRMSLNGLIPEAGAPARSLVFSGSSRPSGEKFDARATLLLKGPSGESRCDITANYPVVAGGRVEAEVRADAVYPEDWVAFATAHESASVPPPEPSRKPGVKSSPFASVSPARVRASAKAVHYAGEVFSNLRGVVTTAPDSISLTDVEFDWRTLPIRGVASLSGAETWRHTVEVGIREADAEKFLGTFSAAAASRLSGKLSATLKASGEAVAPSGLLDASQGALTVSGSGGRLRYAGKPGAIGTAAAGVFDLPGDLAGKIGGVLGRDDAPVSRFLHSMNLVRNALGEIQYDKLEFSAVRTPAGAWEPVKLDVSNSVLRVAASGRVAAPVPGSAWANRRCSVELRVGGRLDFAENMRVWGGASAEEKDGYVLGPVIRLDGTLGNIDANLMKSLSETMPGGGLTERIKGLIP